MKKSIAFGAALLAVSFCGGSAFAQSAYSINGTAGTTLESTNVAGVTGGGTFTAGPTITGGGGNHIGTSAVGATSLASIDHSIGATAYAVGGVDGFTVSVTSVTASNNTGGTIGSGTPTFAAANISAGVSNSITSQSVGASAGAAITVRVAP